MPITFDDILGFEDPETRNYFNAFAGALEIKLEEGQTDLIDQLLRRAAKDAGENRNQLIDHGYKHRLTSELASLVEEAHARTQHIKALPAVLDLPPSNITKMVRRLIFEFAHTSLPLYKTNPYRNDPEFGDDR